MNAKKLKQLAAGTATAGVLGLSAIGFAGPAYADPPPTWPPGQPGQHDAPPQGQGGSGGPPQERGQGGPPQGVRGIQGGPQSQHDWENGQGRQDPQHVGDDWRGRFRGAPWGDGPAPWGWGAPPAASWYGQLPAPDGPPPGLINYWGYQEQPVWDPGYNQWGIWFFGVWIPLIGIG